jgi:hypothetical protein
MNDCGAHRPVNDNTAMSQYVDPLLKAFSFLEISDIDISLCVFI